MKNSSIIASLWTETDLEKKQKNTDKFIEDIPTYAKVDDKTNFTLKNNYFFYHKDVYISKHNRYADYPVHSHQFLEINYMLSGCCREIVNGTEITLNENDLLLIDIGSSHCIKKLGPNDILINILFKDTNISIDWLNKLKKSTSLVYEFLSNRSYGRKNDEHYIIFKHDYETNISYTTENLIAEYFEKKVFYSETVSSYLRILLTELVRGYKFKSKKILTPSQKMITKILCDIETDFLDISLSDEAKKFSYNKNYLSNLLKKETGKTFVSLVNYQKNIQAHSLLINTDQPIYEIMTQIGFSNKSFFYNKYKDQYHELPGVTRSNSSSVESVIHLNHD